MNAVSINDPLAIKKVVAVLERGGIVIIPTDTVYGIGCDALLPQAEERISTIKGRDVSQRVAWLCSDIQMAERYVSIPAAMRARIRAFWPGALTGIFFAVGKSTTIGIRVPNHGFVHGLIRQFGKPLAVSSLNKTGEPPLTRAADTARFAADCVVDAGDLPDSMASTVVDFTQKQPKILREGLVTKNKLEHIFGEIFE